MGFDSFIGLPEETSGLWRPEEWSIGAYSALEYFKLQTVEEAIDHAKKTIRDQHHNVYIVPGFFKESLTNELGKQLEQSTCFVNIDCDLHRSTVEFMDWLLRNNIMISGCIVRFDDWLGTKYSEYHLAGENLALEEITNKYKTHWYQPDNADNIFIYRSHNDNYQGSV